MVMVNLERAYRNVATTRHVRSGWEVLESYLIHEEKGNRKLVRKAGQSWRVYFWNKIMRTSYWDKIQWQILFSLNLVKDPLLLHADGEFPGLQSLCC